jgi:hypothetical protein
MIQNGVFAFVAGFCFGSTFQIVTAVFEHIISHHYEDPHGDAVHRGHKQGSC